MPKVIIDMEMPKRCYDCKFFNHSYSFVFEQDLDECLLERSLIMCDVEEGKPTWLSLAGSKGVRVWTL